MYSWTIQHMTTQAFSLSANDFTVIENEGAIKGSVYG